MKNILIIYPHWPPSNLAGVHRARLISNFLHEFNWHPTVLIVEPGKDFNNNIAVSNKIWAWLQSGLYILATETQAEVRFLQEHKSSGEIVSQNVEAFSFVIKNIITHKVIFREQKNNRFEYAKGFSWEIESEKITDIWSDTL